ncbi:polynucleotide adenylyltransferase PcnB [Ramlibacter sp. PS3R-8]|uniref:polynucleotide adenylyltransferase PcnB n=1 Tax=Ramlibacter sp. PS3R-8 TaxID=3133437 RepID=UPI0030B7222E
MIKKFIDRLLGSGRKPKFGKRQEVGPEVHGIDPTLVDERALSVVRTLKEGGHEAFIVGGAVRDLLLGLRPKDFDVATTATPEQVKALFRRAFIIGRRFRIVHVVFGRGREHEVIEVSTFRAYLESADAEAVSGNERTSKSELAGMKHAVDSSGRVLRDNVWGPQEEDAARRDFTINAMYYDPERRVVVDYHGGIADAKKKLLRMIGDPAARYREDPVRIIRAVRFAAKLAGLGFKIEPKTKAPIVPSLPLLQEVPQSRLFDEMLKLLQTGHSIATIEQLKAQGLARGIYPLLDLIVERADQPFVRAALQDTDRRVGENKPVAPSFLLACVLWAEVRDGWQSRLNRRQHPFPALQEAIDEVFESRIGDISGRGKLGADMREIWMMQPRFEKRTGNTPFSLAEQPRFRAAFDFMRLRADIGEVDDVLADWWQDFSQASDTVREDLVAALRDEQHKQQRKVKRVPKSGDEDGGPRDAPRDTAPAPVAAKKPASAAGPVDEVAHADGEGESSASGEPPRKRRRRRRKPSGQGGGDAQATASGGDGD